MTVKEFKLPDVGEGVAEGELVSWQVSPGDTVSEGDIVAEVETDKALVEVPSRYDGTVKELFAEEGDMVPVGDVIISFEVGGTEGGDAEAEAPDTEGEPGAPAEEAETDTEEATSAETPDGRVFAPPAARKLARELDVDIGEVEGSGPGGRISEADVRAHAESAEVHDETADGTAVTPGEGEAPAEPTGADASETVSADAGPRAERDTTLAVPATRALAEELGVDIHAVPTEKTRDGEAFVEEADVRAFAEREEEGATAAGAEAAGADATAEPAREETVPYRGVRRTIGEQMATSKYTAPHVTHHDTAEIDELVETREELKRTAEEKGVRLTYMAFVLKAVVAGLKEYPILNSELDEEEEVIRLKNYYNIGIAVATDAGLMVPVVKNVDEKGLLEIADEVQELATKARERTISPQEMQGGTFSITNFGAFGGEYATPIINYPETAILGLGAIEERPVVEDGEVVAAHTLPLSLAIDHRVIDGAEAAKFTNTVKEYLAEPTKLLL
ncbi:MULTISPECIES: dihydrolipoamide acetyltransferase family protein [Halolamina]|uniref:Pyruvate dehydrogenase E2 component (Dihydrolipoamide acetyltransferase) n=1 Tax=Halolamina pelagica TaxID=699431 RepID=A0A1I5SJG1_9EURY|nr:MULTISPECIES: dihydrolipoamide acetyltransferase family protein [Halolamina]NHX37032.1 2-oxo acid dehydrogenase subunit E2 [Halolamina sp. R1-12]SFP70869.1 pyruvate dehydrogenase E2 component (dihydrolipoamide acetyltransferase) [Halolamina pelagica]